MVRCILLILSLLLAQMIIDSRVLAKKLNEKELPILNVVETSITEILDSIIMSDKTREYYSDTLIYIVEIEKLADSSFFTFSSTQHLQLKKTEHGVLMFKNHLVVIYSSQSFDCIQAFFSKTSTEHVIYFHEFKNWITPKANVVLDIIEDDSHDYWTFVYKDNKFTTNGFVLENWNK